MAKSSELIVQPQTVTKSKVSMESINQVTALGVKASLLIGFSLLLSYCLEYGVPFPTQLSELPAFLIVIALVGILWTVAIGSFLLAPILLPYLGIGPGLDAVYREEKNRFAALCFVFGLPTLCASWSWLAPTFLAGWQRACIVAALVAGIVVPMAAIRWRLKVNHRISIGKAYSATLFHFLVSNFWLFTTLLLISKTPIWSHVDEFTPPDPGIWSYALGLLFLVLIPTSIAVILGFIGLQLKYNRNEAPVAWWAGLVIASLSVSIIVPWMSSYVAKQALAILGLGGQYMCYESTQDMPEAARNRLGIDAKGHMKRPIAVAIVVGERIFVMEDIWENVPRPKQATAVEYPLAWFSYRHNPIRTRRGAATDLSCEPIGNPVSHVP